MPAEYTPNAQRLLTGRRGQILGYAAKEGWEGWDAVEALVPAAELQDFIIELRSLTQGLGSYTHRFDHLAEAAAQVAAWREACILPPNAAFGETCRCQDRSRESACSTSPPCWSGPIARRSWRRWAPR